MIRRRKTTSRYFVSAIFLCLASGGTQAGEVSGLPAHLTPTVRPDYSFFLGNDFAAADTSDDYRTEQMIVSARIRDSWVAVLDHSIMTREDLADAERGRIDTMTVSLGYEFLSVDSGAQQTSILAGLAIRMVGNFEGERIQNGFHRLIESDTEAIPYTDTRQTDPAAWFLAQHYQRFREATGGGFLNGWDLGYWARAGALATADGQIDGVAGLYAVASRRRWDLWLGVRRDWRSGYDADFVLQDTAAEENKAAVSLGVRFGALVLETVQRMDSSASYGQLSFVSFSANAWRSDTGACSGGRAIRLAHAARHVPGGNALVSSPFHQRRLTLGRGHSGRGSWRPAATRQESRIVCRHLASVAGP